MKPDETKDSMRVGWREWLCLPQLAIPAIKAKIDTGARTSALHTFFLEPFEEGGIQMVRFGIHPLQKRRDIEIFCTAPVKGRRLVSDSGGHREWRFVIETQILLAERQWSVEITLTNRDTMRFRMLLGRTAMAEHLLIEPNCSYLCGREIGRNYLRSLKRVQAR